MELVSNSNSVLCAVTYVHLAPVCGTVITEAEGQMDHRAGLDLEGPTDVSGLIGGCLAALSGVFLTTSTPWRPFTKCNLHLDYRMFNLYNNNLIYNNNSTVFVSEHKVWTRH